MTMDKETSAQESASIIRTPDQRLRVFVSSTLRELAAERVVVQEAIAQLRMAPVLFEMAARPHDARLLYRAYLAQSHIFIGIYWEKYGWVGPGMEISGLEDEYRRANHLPRLIYLKSPAPGREPRLKALLNDIKNDNVSYKYFSSPEELRELVENDLALLLTERFEQTHRPSTTIEKSPTPSSVPYAPTTLIGRRQALKTIQSTLSRPEVHLLTLTGPGGVGKTRLALEVASRLAEEFEQKVYWVSLADIRTPELVLSAIAGALDVRERAGVPLLQSLKEYLGSQRLLLLLDNFEQVISAGPLIAELLAAAPKIKIVITSRSPLHLRGEFEAPVAPLAVPDPAQDSSVERLSQAAAVRLFVDRARAVRPDFTLSADTAVDIAEIVRRLDGLPLAIELAAARIRMLPPAAILERLDSRLKLLIGGAQDLPPRQKTIQKTIDWSFNLLGREAQTLFRRLSVFSGGFTLSAVESVCDPEGEFDVFLELASLNDNSLVWREPTQPNQEPRFGLLHTIHEYAWECLLESGEANKLRSQHAHYFAQLASWAGQRIYSEDSEACLDHLALEYANLRVALDWFQQNPQEMERGWQMMIDINWLWYRRGYLNEARQWYERAIGQAMPISRNPLRANILLHAGVVAMWQSDFPAAARLMDGALPILREKGEASQLAVGLFTRGVLAVNQDDTNTALDTLEEVHALLGQTGQEWFQGMTLLHLGNVYLSLDDIEQAHSYMEQATTYGTAINDHWIIASTVNNFGEIARYQEDYAEAERYYLMSKEMFEEVNSAPDIARANQSLGYVALFQGDYLVARDLFEQSMNLHEKLGVKRGVVEALAGLAALLAAQCHDNEETAKEAIRLSAAVRHQFAVLEAGIWPADRKDILRATGYAQAVLDEEVVRAAEEEGRLLSLKETRKRALRMGTVRPE